MIKKLIIAILGLALVIGGLYAIKAAQQTAASSGGGWAPPPVAVTTAVVEERRLKKTLDAIGSLSAVQGVMVSSEVSGSVAAIHFESGTKVAKGALLVELDASSEEAQLKAAVAQTRLAKIRLDRAKELMSKNSIAQTDLDTAEAVFSEAEAQVELLESQIAKKRIRAPFDGQLGIRQIERGHYLNSGAAIVSLQSLAQIHVDFSLPQQHVSALRNDLPVEVTTDAFPGEVFTGQLSAISPEVSVSTRSITLQATLDNRESKLLPGMYALAQVIIDDDTPSLVLPATCVQFAPYGDSVFVVVEQNGSKVATQKVIKVIGNFGDYVSVDSGLSAGDVVVSTGGFKLRDGALIVEKNAFAPDMEIAPKPDNS